MRRLLRAYGGEQQDGCVVSPDRPVPQDIAAAADGDLRLRVVCIGASAGGLEAIQQLLRMQKPGRNCTFIIAQHLAPSHPSLMAGLLDRDSELTVVEATGGMRLRADTVFVGPPNRDITIHGMQLHLAEPPARIAPSPSIDVLFESQASSQAENAIAVVLSGTGSDGSLGLRAVRRAGGLTMAQRPESAAFDGMPRAAIATGAVEVIDSPEALGLRIDSLVGEAEAELGSTLPDADAESIQAITKQLRKSVGIDFSRYKETTLRRQVQRRMAIGRIHDVNEYSSLLKSDADEARGLSSNLLVTVTSFFRDPTAYSSLASALAQYMENLDNGEPLRVWVAGCATGEEVYSIAMLVGEILGFPVDLDHHLKIFGTDLDDGSLAIARRANYSLADLERIPERLRAAYTKPGINGFQISDAIRDCTIFARHDVTRDPPFPRMDLISCRNVLIYFTAELQQQVHQSIRFSLKPQGMLFLGQAESLDSGVTAYRAVDADQRVYLRTGGGTDRQTPRTELQAASSARTRNYLSPDTGAREYGRGEQIALLEALVRFNSLAFLVLDANHHLVRVVGDVNAYCQVPEGRIGAVDWSFLRPELQDEVRALLLVSEADGEQATGQPVFLPALDRTVQLNVSPLTVCGTQYAVVAFLTSEARALDEPAASDQGMAFSQELRRLEQELVASQGTLHRSLSELQAVNQELEATSEELQASSEELQASNEELQASNNELGSLNQELRDRGTALEQLNTDLGNIQASLSQGMVIVDANLLILRFTPLAVRVFALVDTDMGKPLLGVPTTVVVPGLESALRDVLNGAARRSLNTSDHAPSYLVQVLPYLGKDQQRLGAIVTLTDVSEMVALRVTADTALEDLRGKSVLLEHQAAYDSATGLFNRHYFTEAVRHELERAGRNHDELAVAWIDLDRFKEVNDEFGHEAGDITLRTIAERITASVRSADVVGRLGGDEFGLLLCEYGHLNELDAVLDRILLAIRTPINIGSREVRISASIGVALYPTDDTTPDGLLRASDAAMYTTKHITGDNYAFYTNAMNAGAVARRALRLRIAEAIEAQDFELHYQPIVRSDSGEVSCLEALLRWRRADGVVSAAEFIPFCESSGQIRAIGEIGVALLDRDRRALAAAGHAGLSLSINLSATQLEDRAVLDAFARLPAPRGLSNIVVEVLESVFLPDRRKALDGLQELVDRGVRTSVDDFGSGYSNFGLLESLAPDFIKIDRSLLCGNHSSAQRLTLIRSMVEMSHALGSLVVVEGVETEDQRRLGQDAGADLIQGYLIARPMPLPALLAWLGAAQKPTA